MLNHHLFAWNSASRPINSSLVVLSTTLFVMTSSLDRVAAEDEAIEPLHQTIDRLIEAKVPDYEQRASASVSDFEFVRRVYLDLTGRIPSRTQTAEFLDDGRQDKRRQLVDELLQRPEHVRHLQQHFDVLLMQRRPKKHIELAEWRKYLFASLRENKPWDKLVRELLSVDGTEPATRPAARFLLDRELQPAETTRDLGRVFLGRDLQCAQCHDHPLVNDYAQQHYFGLQAFLNRSYVFTDPKTKLASIGEKAEGDVKFTSVFTSVEAQTAPRMLDLPELADPEKVPEPYIAKPDKNTRGIPTYSRRLLLAGAITASENRAFTLNIANRLWALMMGRGLVEPLDMFHSDNPPTHPELLDQLADDLVQHNYDMRRLIRQIALTDTYRRSSLLRSDAAVEPDTYLTAALKPLTPEQMAYSMMQATGVVESTRAAVLKELESQPAETPAAESQTAESDAAAAETAEGEAAKPQAEEPTPETKPARSPRDDAFQVESMVHQKLAPHLEAFVTVFGSTNEASRFDATATQALFVLNGELIGTWLKPKTSPLMQRLMALDDADEIANELFLSLLIRPPTPSEIAFVESMLNDASHDRSAALKQLARSLLSSAEFRLNH